MIYYKAVFYFDDKEYIVDRRNITSINVGQKDRGSVSDISFGIYCNSGQISFVDDANRTILNYAESGKLASGIKCKVYLINSLAKSSTLIAEMKTQEWNYDNSNYSVSVNIKDELEEWQNIEVASVPIKVDAPIEGDIFVSSAQDFDKFKSNYFIPILTQNNYKITEENFSEVQQRIHIRNPLLEQCSLWAFGTKLCELCASRIYKSKNKIIMRYYGGV